MQVSNQDMVIRQYAQTAQKTKAAEGTAATEAVQSEKQAAAQKNQTPDKDRVELSSDTKVTSKMSDSERASLVNSLKADLDNQMNRFTNMMVQTFQKQGITAAAQSDEFWRTIASGNFTGDAKTKAEAQAATPEAG